ncbi:hypothetical protein BH20CHL6_BH20CHL6_16270 [soil metagenome]
MSGSMPRPGPSFVREERVRLRGPNGSLGPEVLLGMSEPSIMDDGWWLATLWGMDETGVIETTLVAPLAGPPPEQPVSLLGRILAGALSGLLDQEDGRQLIRLRMLPAEDESRPWRRPLLLWLAVRWDPVRGAVMRPNELAREILRAFARSVEVANGPSSSGPA